MFHLPHDGARVMVWPTPGLSVPAAAPRADMPVPRAMSPDGQVVQWDEFRYRQYTEGVLHFHDPRSQVERAARPSTEHHRKHVHAPKLPAELQKQLDEIAAKDKAASEKAKADDAKAKEADAKALADSAKKSADEQKGKE